MSSDKLHKSFANLLKYHSRGHALYHPIPMSEVQIGSLGMFDDNGHWYRIYEDIRFTNLAESYDGPLESKEREAGKGGVFASLSARSLETTFGVSAE